MTPESLISSAVIGLVLLNILQAIGYQLERRFLIKCIMSRNYTEMKQAERPGDQALKRGGDLSFDLPPGDLETLNQLMNLA